MRDTRKLDSHTFVDERPASGVACKPFPATQTVGGESGLLLDSALWLPHEAAPQRGPRRPVCVLSPWRARASHHTVSYPTGVRRAS